MSLRRSLTQTARHLQAPLSSTSSSSLLILFPSRYQPQARSLNSSSPSSSKRLPSLDTPVYGRPSLNETTSRPGSNDGTGAKDYAGPMPMGVGIGGLGGGGMRLGEARPKKWGELGVGGKIVRVGQKTVQSWVVVLGGTLFFVIAVSVGTELFSPNSPTVIFNRAVERIKKSGELDLYLLPPYSFHPPHASNYSPSSNRSQYSDTRAQRTRLNNLPERVTVDAKTGKEQHSFIFLIEGQQPGSARSPTGWLGSWLGWAKGGVRDGWQGVKGLAGEGMEELRARGWVEEKSLEEKVEDKVMEEKKEVEAAEGKGGLTGMLGGLFGVRKGGDEGGGGGGIMSALKKRGLPALGTYTTGECHVICEKDAESSARLQLKSITVFVPSLNVPRPHRFSVPVDDESKGWLASLTGGEE